MLNDRLAAVQLVYEKLTAMERAIDEALTCAAELTASVPRARKRANLSPTVAADAVQLVGESMASIFAARQKLMESHAAFADVRDELRVPIRMPGDLWKHSAKAEPEDAQAIAQAA